MRLLGIDPAFANMGLCAAIKNGSQVDVVDLKLITTDGQNKKTVRKNSDDLRRAKELHTGLHSMIDEHRPHIIFAEVPQGAQNARAAWGLGIAVGILASIQVPFIQLTPLEVKLCTVVKMNGIARAAHCFRRLGSWASHRLRHNK